MTRFTYWTARILSFLLVALVALIFVGEGVSAGFPNPAALTLEENLGLAAFFLMTAGLVLAWKKPDPGALLAILGYGAFCVIEGRIMTGLFALYPATALLFVASRYLARNASGRPAPGEPGPAGPG